MSYELEVGSFPIRAVHGAYEFGFAGENNTDQIAVLIEFLDGPNKGKRTMWFGSFTAKAEERTLEALSYLGWDCKSIMDMSTLGTVDAIGVVKEEEYNGKSRTRLAFINRSVGPAFKKPMSDVDLRAFEARMKGKVVAFQQKHAAPKNNGASASRSRTAGPRDDVPPPSDDDFQL